MSPLRCQLSRDPGAESLGPLGLIVRVLVADPTARFLGPDRQETTFANRAIAAVVPARSTIAK